MVLATNLGYPRIGPNRELKRAQERYWRGRIGRDELLRTCESLRSDRWSLQEELGVAHIPSNDFTLYDHVLDTAALVGAVPERYGSVGDTVELDTYFAMARGATDVPAMEMTKWFDTNYHYIVPEFEPSMSFHLSSTKPVDEFREAANRGVQTRPVLLGPVSFLLLGKSVSGARSPLEFLESVLPVYEEVLRQLAREGATWVQIDEPCMVLDQPDAVRDAWKRAFDRLSQASPSLKILVATYFGDLRENAATAFALPVSGLHLDLVRGPQQLEEAIERLPSHMTLSAGIVDGRDVLRTDLDHALAVLTRAVDRFGSDRVFVAPSCSLLHVPVDLDTEKSMDEELRSWLSFAKQKLQEVALLSRALNEGAAAVEPELTARRHSLAQRRRSPRIHDPAVARRLDSVSEEMFRRASPPSVRLAAQKARFNLPDYPTTTIGSFPQTQAIRHARAQFNRGEITPHQYERFLRDEIREVLEFQEELGLDVLVHGEPERTDMVEYFAQQMDGFAVTQNGWVQSYGSRCVRPPIVYGDVSRPRPMTVKWAEYAQSLTSRPVKGMLTGPITMLQWSFVRSDQPRSRTAYQIALAIRDEVTDLERAGVGIIQIDEPALREGLPLRDADRSNYLDWAVKAFRLASSGVRDDTQIHTHMCYAEFNEIIEAIAALDADVISIEASRSKMELLEAFQHFKYPNQVGPGVYDIHSPRVPEVDEMRSLLTLASRAIPREQLWVNPDCGLKTRNWDEVKSSLAHMKGAAEAMRSR